MSSNQHILIHYAIKNGLGDLYDPVPLLSRENFLGGHGGEMTFEEAYQEIQNDNDVEGEYTKREVLEALHEVSSKDLKTLYPDKSFNKVDSLPHKQTAKVTDIM